MLVDATDADRDAEFRHQLGRDGHSVVGIFAPEDDLTAEADSCAPDILVARTERPTPHLISRLNDLGKRQLCPIILYSVTDEAAVIQAAVKAGVNAIAAGSAHDAAFHTLSNVAFARFNEARILRKERDDALAKLAERKLVERAKGIMMKERNLSEEEAYRLLRKFAMDRSEPLKDLAARVIEASNLLK